jgi:glycosyltransferase involved in cell wall biosynthesis
MNVWLMQTGEPLHIDGGNPRPMRAMNLANALVDAGHKVVLWSSAFYHQEKRHRSRATERIAVSSMLEVRLIPSPGYEKNIGLGRLWDHAVLARNLKKQLGRETSIPDVAFIGYPPIEAAAVMTRWLLERGVLSVLDVKDQWPTLFLEALPRSMRLLGRAAFAPYFHLAKRSMRDSSGLTAMADDFLNWATRFAGRQRNEIDRVVPLTSPVGLVSEAELQAARRWWDEKGISANGHPRVCFVGTHSSAFDIGPVFEAARRFAGQSNGCEFIICGDGPTSGTLRSMAAELPNVHFPGWVNRAQIETLAERSFASLAPYKNTPGFIMSVPNKIVDALSLGLPVLSPLRGEVAKLIASHNVGLRYGADSEKTLFQCIETLVDNAALRQTISKNALGLYREQYSFERVYGGLVKHLEALSLKKKPPHA